ncbi:MAG: 2-phospho-L-lactate transferase [Afipia sp.]|nr:2-phospho-L-lactate transferase [Afipia sp.]
MQVLALAGGVGGAKLAAGLANLLGERLTVVVNTADDFEHLGFHISPDLDTVTYTLAGIANPATGWGLADESWQFMSQIERLGGPTWFSLGDRDVALHAMRTNKLRNKETLSSITSTISRSLGIQATILPMTDDCVQTFVRCDGQLLAFQEYFVRKKCEPIVSEIIFKGIETAQPNSELTTQLDLNRPITTIICPSNPYLSIDPILAVPGMRDWLIEVSDVIVAVSPIVAGSAIKGPAAKIMSEIGLEPSAATVCKHYEGLIDGFVVDSLDESITTSVGAPGPAIVALQTIMRSEADRTELAKECLAFAERLLVKVQQ